MKKGDQTKEAVRSRYGDFKVGVFPGPTKTRFNAYTLWYNPAWDGCCEHTVRAKNGTEAKKLAITVHKVQCVGGKA